MHSPSSSLSADSANHSTSNPLDLENREQEYLLTAGNGFILLAYLMKADDEVEGAPDELTSTIRRAILSEMPTDGKGCEIGVTLMINTLKAFCNLYNYSLGPLGVATVTPVLKLIKDLEKMPAQ